MNQISQSVYATTRVAAKETNDSCSGIQATGGIREGLAMLINARTIALILSDRKK